MAITIHTGRSGRSQRDIIHAVSDITGGDLSEVTAVGYGVTVPDAVALEYLRAQDDRENGQPEPDEDPAPADTDAETEPEPAAEPEADATAKRGGRRKSGGK